MAGLFLIIFAVLSLISLIMIFIDDLNDDFWKMVSIICLVVTVIYLAAIPICRINSKQNVEYAKIFQETLNHNRSNEQELNVFERAKIMEEINDCNSVISSWKVKGQKWYNNKWYYHPDTQKVEYVK